MSKRIFSVLVAFGIIAASVVAVTSLTTSPAYAISDCGGSN